MFNSVRTSHWKLVQELEKEVETIHLEIQEKYKGNQEVLDMARKVAKRRQTDFISWNEKDELILRLGDTVKLYNALSDSSEVYTQEMK